MQQQYRGHRRRSRRKPSFWQAHRTLGIALLSTVSVAAVAAASIGIYEHRLAAERIGIASRGTTVPMVPPGKIFVESTQTKIAAKPLGLPPYVGKRSSNTKLALATPNTSSPPAATADKQPDAVSTSDGLPSDGVKTGDGSSGNSSVAMDTGSAPTQSGGFGGGSGYQNFGGSSSGYSSGPPTSQANYQPPAGPNSPGPTTTPPPSNPSPQVYVPPPGPITPPTTPSPGPKIASPGPITPPTQPITNPQPTPPSGPPVVYNPPPTAPGPTISPPAPPTYFPVISTQPTTPPPTIVATNSPVPGSTPQNPLTPVVPSNSGPNQLLIPAGASGWTYFDPVVAIGFNYQLEASSPSNPLTFGITDIRVTTKVGNGQYQLWLYDVLTGQYVNVGQEIDADANGDFNVVAYLDTFDAAEDAEFGITDPNDGLTQFSIRGIDPNADLDPDDATQFITGLMFEGTINGNLFITPLTLDTDIANAQDPDGPTQEVALPEPGTLSVFGLGLAGMALLRRRRRAA